MELIPVDYTNYKCAIEIQKKIFPHIDGTLNILASLGRDLFQKRTGLSYEDDYIKYFIAYDNDEAVGITGIYYYENIDPKSAWLAWFGVLPNKRRKHYGEQILQRTMRMARQEGFETMRLYTDAVGNATAIKLYEKMGFVGEKYSAEQLSYDCRIYSKSLNNKSVSLWDNKMLGLSHQSELEQIPKERMAEILNLYENHTVN